MIVNKKYGVVKNNTTDNDYNFLSNSATTYTVPPPTSKLRNYCFYQMTNLTSIDISFSVTSIGDSCFNGCTGLISIYLPGKLVSIGSNCFQSCTNLTTINCGFTVDSITGSPWGATSATINYGVSR